VDVAAKLQIPGQMALCAPPWRGTSGHLSDHQQGCRLSMFRFLLRILGYLAIAAGFVLLLIDGARSIANSELMLTSLNDLGLRFVGERFLLLQPAIERQIHPLLWDPVLSNILRLPGAVPGLALGFWLLWLGRQPVRQVGYLTRQ
jgi:hypothetical protein